MNMRMITRFVSCVMNISWHKRAGVSLVDNGFAQDMDRVALSKAMGE